MGRTRQRVERLEHFFGDMIDARTLKSIAEMRRDTKKEVNKTLSELMDELGTRQTVLITKGPDEYSRVFR